MRGIVVLRPQPGNDRTAHRLRKGGLDVVQAPLFAVRPVDWRVPDAAGFDALLLTSANAVRHAGPQLARLAGMPVVAVGGATAAAARAAGLQVAITGDGDGADAARLAREAGWGRLLHLAGRDHVPVVDAEAVVVYASEPVAVADLAARCAGRVVLLHSRRAAGRFDALFDGDRSRVVVAALSDAVATLAGQGWAAIRVADMPTDMALVELAARLALTPMAVTRISGA